MDMRPKSAGRLRPVGGEQPLGPPGFVAEASTPWGRVRVTIWTTWDLSLDEREQLVEHLGAVTTALVGRSTEAALARQTIGNAVLGDHAKHVKVELLAAALPPATSP